VSGPLQEAADYLEHAIRDLDRAADRLGRVAGAAPEQEAAHVAAEGVLHLLETVRRVLLP
jgi:hypothetical protein